MNALVNVAVHVQALANERLQLVLEMVGTGVTWSKVYNGSLFLSMDAQDLELLEAIPFPAKGGPTYRLKGTGRVRIEALQRMSFVQIPVSDRAAGMKER